MEYKLVLVIVILKEMKYLLSSTIIIIKAIQLFKTIENVIDA